MLPDSSVLLTLALLATASATPYWDEWSDPAIGEKLSELRSLRGQRGASLKQIEAVANSLIQTAEEATFQSIVRFELIEAHVQRGLPYPQRVISLVQLTDLDSLSPQRRAALFCYAGDASRIHPQLRANPQRRVLESVRWYSRGINCLKSILDQDHDQLTERDARQINDMLALLVRQIREVAITQPDEIDFWIRTVDQQVNTPAIRQSIVAGFQPTRSSDGGRPLFLFLNGAVLASLVVVYFWRRTRQMQNAVLG